MKKKYDVIIVNYNGKDIISRCIESIYKSEVLPQKIIIVDNASSDSSVELIRKKFPHVLLVSKKTNLGFGRGNNEGMRHSTAPFILFLNNDVILDKSCTKELLGGFEKPEVAVLDPIIYKGWQKKKNQSLYAFGAQLSEAGFAYARYDDGTRDDLNNFSAACCMARSDIFKKIKFEKRFFLYYEEPMLSVSLLKLGYKIGRIRQAKCYHLESYSTPEKATAGVVFRQFYGVQNRFYMLAKHWPAGLLLKILLIDILHLWYVIIFSLVHKKFSQGLRLIYLTPWQFIRGLANRDQLSTVDFKWYTKLTKTPFKQYLSLGKKVFASED